jgi:hypothetical protein
MKKLLLAILCLGIVAGSAMAWNMNANPAMKAVDWNIVRTTTEAENFDLPTSGVYSIVGAKTAVLALTSTASLATYSIMYYQSNGTKLVSTETLTVGTAKTLLTPYFKFRAACSASESGDQGTGEVYVLGY